nr:cilia- and flagella-associated protein 53 [Helicoverpa armigera]
MEPLPPRQKAPKDGQGPRGWPDCYYTSRVLDSTFRYVKFVKKLRALEDEQRRGAVNKLKEEKDKQYSDFFIRCDRRSLINNVARRVDLCLTSYQEDLKAKRQRLVDLLTAEEEMNIRKFVEQAQAGAEALWQDKKDRLAFLLDKRQKEHEEKYKDIPISKCVHAHPCIVKLRCKEMQEVQKMQIKENQAKKMSEIEIEKMWHEVAMKESEALAARLELDAIERRRRTEECIKHSDEQMALRKEQRRKDQERLKEESLRIKKMFEEMSRNEDEESRKMQEKRLEEAKERSDMIKERQETVAKQQAEAKLVNDTWDSLAAVGLDEEEKKMQLKRRKQMELDICNRRISKIRRDKGQQSSEDAKILEQEAKRQQDVIDQRRCAYLKWSKKMQEEVRDGIIQQMKDNALTRERKAKEDADQVEYQRQVFKQVEALVKHRELTEAQARKIFQSQLLEQIDYNKLLKDRARAEELDQIRKCESAADEYQYQITKILCRLFFSEEIHPFMKQMYKGLKMQDKCPCSKPDYCAVGPKPITGAKPHSVPVLGPKGGPASNAPPATKVQGQDAPAKSPSK